LFDGILAILRGRSSMSSLLGPTILGNFWRRRADDFLRVVEAQSGLVRNASLSGLFTSSLFTASTESTTMVAVGRFAGGADDFLVVLVADKNDGAVLRERT